MPASLFHETEHSSSAGNGLEDQRALQLALELSMLGLSDSDSLGNGFDSDPRGKKSQNTTECVPVPSSEHVAEIVGRQGKSDDMSRLTRTVRAHPFSDDCLFSLINAS